MQELLDQFTSHPTLALVVMGFVLLAGFGFLWLLITRLPKLIIRLAVGASLLVIFAAVIVIFTMNT